MPMYADRVADTTTTMGTGSVVLSTVPPTGYIAFFTAFGTGVDFYYAIDGGAKWEVGLGQLTAANTLARTTVLRSSNANALVDFGIGIKTVTHTLTAEGLDLKLNVADAPAFVCGEIPGGLINGVNDTFTLAYEPTTNSEALYLMGMRMARGEDYTITGALVTMINIPVSGMAFLADYRY